MMFKFKGKSNKEMGVYAKEENFLGKAPVNFEEIAIDGKDGEELIALNYNNFASTLNAVVMLKDNYDEVLKWLSGKGELEYLDRVTTIQFLDTYQINTNKKPFSVAFVRSPFWYKKDDDFTVATNSIRNDGNVSSKPIIKLTKNNNNKNEFRVNGVQFIYTFPNDEDYVEIDCKEMNAYHGGFYRNNYLEIGFDFPVLKPGDNQIELLQGDASIEFKRKDTWL